MPNHIRIANRGAFASDNADCEEDDGIHPGGVLGVISDLEKTCYFVAVLTFSISFAPIAILTRLYPRKLMGISAFPDSRLVLLVHVLDRSSFYSKYVRIVCVVKVN